MNNTMDKIDIKHENYYLIKKLDCAFKSINMSNLADNFLQIQSSCKNFVSKIISPPLISGTTQQINQPQELETTNHDLSINNTITPHHYNIKSNHLTPLNNSTTNQLFQFETSTEDKIFSFIHNAISSFINKCFKNRDAFLEDLKGRNNNAEVPQRFLVINTYPVT